MHGIKTTLYGSTICFCMKGKTHMVENSTRAYIDHSTYCGGASYIWTGNGMMEHVKPADGASHANVSWEFVDLAGRFVTASANINLVVLVVVVAIGAAAAVAAAGAAAAAATAVVAAVVELQQQMVLVVVVVVELQQQVVPVGVVGYVWLWWSCSSMWCRLMWRGRRGGRGGGSGGGIVEELKAPWLDSSFPPNPYLQAEYLKDTCLQP